MPIVPIATIDENGVTLLVDDDVLYYFQLQSLLNKKRKINKWESNGAKNTSLSYKAVDMT